MTATPAVIKAVETRITFSPISQAALSSNVTAERQVSASSPLPESIPAAHPCRPSLKSSARKSCLWTSKQRALLTQALGLTLGAGRS